MKTATILAANFASIAFLIFAAYALHLNRTGFAVTALIFALLTATTVTTTKSKSDE